MKKARYLRQTVLWTAVVGICVPQVALAAPPAVTKAPAAVDVSLHQGGTLLGQVVDDAGRPQKGLAVVLHGRSGPLARGKTDARGYFAFRGLTRGTYQVVTPAGPTVCRVWTPDVAPPAARPGVLIVTGDQTVRGAAWGFLGERPLLVAGLIAAAIAVPIAVTSDRGPSSP